ncbi:unnamed protein product, partial [Rotaria sordida]
SLSNSHVSPPSSTSICTSPTTNSVSDQLALVSEAICESAASILKGHIHNNRSLQHKSLDDEVFLHWNAPPLHLADKFIEQSIDDYFINKKDKTWLFYRKSEQYQPWKLLSPVSLVLNRFRSEQVPRLPELNDD